MLFVNPDKEPVPLLPEVEMGAGMSLRMTLEKNRGLLRRDWRGKARGLGLIWEQGEEYTLGWHTLEVPGSLTHPPASPRHSKYRQQEHLICALS